MCPVFLCQKEGAVLEGLAAMMVTPRQPPEEEAAPPGPRVTAADMDNLLVTSSPAPTWPPPLT